MPKWDSEEISIPAALSCRCIPQNSILYPHKRESLNQRDLATLLFSRKQHEETKLQFGTKFEPCLLDNV